MKSKLPEHQIIFPESSKKSTLVESHHDEQDITHHALHTVATTAIIAHMSNVHLPGACKLAGAVAEVVSEIVENPSDIPAEKIICGGGISVMKTAINSGIAVGSAIIAGEVSSVVTSPIGGALAATTVGSAAYELSDRITTPIANVLQKVCHDALETTGLESTLAVENVTVAEIPAYYQRACNLFYNKEYANALNLVNKVLQLNPSYAEAYCLSGSCHREMGQLQKAIAAYTHAISLNPQYPWSYYNLALAYSKLNDDIRTLTTINTFLKRIPDDISAIRLRDAILDKIPVYYQRACNLFYNKEYANALNLVNKVLQLNASHAEAHCLSGSCHREMHQPEKAITAYNHAINLNPQYPWSYYNQAVVYINLGEHQKALNDTNKFLAMCPGNTAALAIKDQCHNKLHPPKQPQIPVKQVVKPKQIGLRQRTKLFFPPAGKREMPKATSHPVKDINLHKQAEAHKRLMNQAMEVHKTLMNRVNNTPIYQANDAANQALRQQHENLTQQQRQKELDERCRQSIREMVYSNAAKNGGQGGYISMQSPSCLKITVHAGECWGGKVSASFK